MDTVKKFFPFSFGDKADIMALIFNVLIYFVAGAICGIILGLLAQIPYIGFVFGITASAIGLYCTGGIVLSILHYCKVIK